MKKQISNEDIEKQIKQDPKFKRELARRSFYWFFTIYRIISAKFLLVVGYR